MANLYHYSLGHTSKSVQAGERGSISSLGLLCFVDGSVKFAKQNKIKKIKKRRKKNYIYIYKADRSEQNTSLRASMHVVEGSVKHL